MRQGGERMKGAQLAAKAIRVLRSIPFSTSGPIGYGQRQMAIKYAQLAMRNISDPSLYK
jgi:hypothetical protein